MDYPKKKTSKKPVKGQYSKRDKLPAINVAKNPGMNPEMKAVDSVGTLALSNTTTGAGHTILVNGSVQGTDRFNRVGRRINIKSINVRMYVYTSQGSPAVIDDLLRFALVWDEQPTGSLPVISDYWQDTSTSGILTTNLLSHNNLNNTARFRMLRTLSVPINAELQCTETNQGRAFIEWNIKCNFITQYNAGNTGALSDITTGAIYVIGWGNNSNPAQWSADVATRIKYQDP